MGAPAAAPLVTLERLRRVRERLLETPGLFPIAIGRREGEALRHCVRAEAARRTLEVGLGWAVATLFICDGLLENGGEVTHVAADPYQRASPKYEGAGLRALEEAGVRDLVEFYEEESQLLLPRLVTEGRRFDLAFVDGSHRFERVFLDLVYCGRLVNGGIVFVDDVQLPEVQRAIDSCVSEQGWQIEAEGEEGAAHHWLVARTIPSASQAAHS